MNAIARAVSTGTLTLVTPFLSPRPGRAEREREGPVHKNCGAEPVERPVASLRLRGLAERDDCEEEDADREVREEQRVDWKGRLDLRGRRDVPVHSEAGGRPRRGEEIVR